MLTLSFRISLSLHCCFPFHCAHFAPLADAEKGALTIIRLPAENKKQVKKKKKNVVSYGKSLVEMYSTAIPISEQVDPYALKALSKNENLNEKIYALIPKSVVEVSEYDDVTHVTLQSSSPLFVNQNDNVKQHIITTTHHQKSDDIPNIASCVVPESDESLKGLPLRVSVEKVASWDASCPNGEG